MVVVVVKQAGGKTFFISFLKRRRVGHDKKILWESCDYPVPEAGPECQIFFSFLPILRNFSRIISVGSIITIYY